MIVGFGTDIVETDRIRTLLAQNADRFLHRWFGVEEIEYCTRMANPHLHFAARLAAKEAVFKALRLDPDAPPPWRSILIVNEADGAPRLILKDYPKAAAERLGVGTMHVSLSHCERYAVASVVAERFS